MKLWAFYVLAPASILLTASASTPAAEDVPGRKLALLVAVRQYNRNELRPLNHTENDVNGLAKTLATAGYRRVVLMTQTVGAEETRFLPTAANIRKEIRGLLADRKEGDSVLIALSGHGVQFRGKDEAFFCPADARLADRSTLISLNELYHDLEKCQAGFKLMLVDACRNDPQSDNSKARSEVNLESVTRPQLKRPPGGLAVLFSCSEGEKSYESAELKRGVFFHYVLKGLDGAADYNTDRKVSLDELALYVRNEVPEHVKEEFDADLRQMPELVGRTRGLVPLVELAGLTRDKPLPPPKATFAPPNPTTPPRTVDLPGRFKMLTSRTTGMKLVLIPKGEYQRGAPESDESASIDEKPQHMVRITKSFYLGQHEVTQGAWKTVMGTEPWKGREYTNEGPDFPATWVSWSDTQEFCRRLSERDGVKYRLPTEAEWEYACRGGTTTRFSFGDDESQLGDYAWFGGSFDDGNAKHERYAHRVGLKKANPFGLFDMHGNVWEWCHDGWHDGQEYVKHAGKTVSDPQGPSDQILLRAYRGGGWFNDGWYCRSALRYGLAPAGVNYALGFRVAAAEK
ncbi:MAG: SUMF1/EgtB/PvdO family nonheme iron enzyme [Planctomycetaceae bacterium]|nr:SUMF1/EgtB/PvdO family nonheme iron enzyme [Planctomycetaceae bacterium]